MTRARSWTRFRPLILAAAHGMCATALVALFIFARSEDRVFDRIATRSLRSAKPHTLADSLRALAKATSAITRVGDRYTNAVGAPSGIRESLLRSSDYELLGGGGCGSASIVMARLSDRIGVPVRIAHMRCGDVYGCHIVVEANVHGKWSVVDPWFNLVYPLADGTLASAEDLRTMFPQFQSILPPDYLKQYRYEGVRYTNWEKIPVAGSMLHRMARGAFGASVDSISVRTFIMNYYRMYAWMVVLVWLGVTAASLAYWTRGRDARGDSLGQPLNAAS